jgi:CRISPR-associated endoribonuclease Cas6
MPHSLVLNLLPQSPISTNNLSGRHLHALFLDLVQSVDVELANTLHQQLSEKAFTLSPLQVEWDSWGNSESPLGIRGHRGGRRSNLSSSSLLQFQHDRAIPAGTPCWWRISLLDESLFGKLTHLFLSLSPKQPWHLGSADLQVTTVLGNPQPTQPWANFSTYAQIYEQASDGISGDRPQDARKIHFLFCTPTTFRETQYDCALPTRDFVFHSLLRRWNHYSNIPFPKTIVQPIYPSFFDIRTEIVMDSRSKLIGCVGAMTFQIMGEVDPLTIKQINTLADFAFYAGVGRKTPMGMGIVRRT